MFTKATSTRNKTELHEGKTTAPNVLCYILCYFPDHSASHCRTQIYNVKTPRSLYLCGLAGSE